MMTTNPNPPTALELSTGALKRALDDNRPAALRSANKVRSEVIRRSISGTRSAAGRSMVLVVEDDPYMRHAYGRAFASDPRVDAAICGSVATARAAAAGPWNMIVVDLNLPDGDGAEFLHELSIAHHPAQLVACSGLTYVEQRERLAAAFKDSGVPDRVRILVKGEDEKPGDVVGTVLKIAKKGTE